MADPADLEPLAARLEQSGDYRILRRVPVVTRYFAGAGSRVRGVPRDTKFLAGLFNLHSQGHVGFDL
jgi:hypothetical protein